MTALTTLAAYPGPYAGDGGFHWWFLFFPFGFVLFWIAVFVVLRMFLWRRWGGPWGRGWGPGGPGGSGGRVGTSAEQTLAGRFAAGDIDEREYRARLEVLRSSPPDAG